MTRLQPPIVGLLVASLALAGCQPEPRDASFLYVHSYQGRHGSIGYVIVDENKHEVPEDEFARLYEARTHSTKLRDLDHERHDGAIPLSVTGVLGGAATVPLAMMAETACAAPPGKEHDGCGGSVALAGIFGVLSATFLVLGIYRGIVSNPTDHDLDRPKTEQLVDEYNSSHEPPTPEARTQEGASRETHPAISPLVGPAGVGFRF